MKTAKTNPAELRKMYNGPFGSYRAGSVGAVLNALCEQEGRSCGVVDCYAIGNGKVYSSPTCANVLATFEWTGDEIVFDWVSKTA